MFFSPRRIVVTFLIATVAAVSGVTLADEYRHPIEPVHISGSFGEYRKGGRFHMGLDYKTFNRLRIPVRIYVPGTVIGVHVSENNGYGNALFIATSDSVFTYAHLNDFKGASAELESFRRALELLHPAREARVNVPGWFRFKANDIVARTGETGIGPPHLHHEVRKNGEFLDPLGLPGMAIPDRTAPVIQAVYIEWEGGFGRYAASLKKSESSARQKDEYAIETAMTAPKGKFRVRLSVGAYDTMAATNINGISRVRLSSGGKVLYEKDLLRVAVDQIGAADRFYNGQRTVVGREYVYSLGPDLAVIDLKNVRIDVEDASGNVSHLSAEIKSADGKDADTKPADGKSADGKTSGKPGEAKNSASSDAGFVPVNTGSVLTSVSGKANLVVSFPPGTLLDPGRVRITPLDNPALLALNPARALTWPTENGRYELVGPAWNIESSGNLAFREGASVRVVIPGAVDDKEGLYLLHPTTARWVRLGLPRKYGAGADYDFKMRTFGIVARLRDVSPPVVGRPLLWDEPANRTEEGRDFIREYAIREWGAGVDPRGSSVLLDGRKIPFEWVEDSLVFRVLVPEEMVHPSGSMISIQAKDKAGNLSAWEFDYIVPGDKR